MNYVYLTRPEWAEPWINGGKIPLNPARNYLSSERNGTKTPDELRQRFVLGDGGDAVESIESLFGNSCTWITNSRIKSPDGQSKFVNYAATSIKDSLILCFSLSLSKTIMHRLGKQCVLQVPNMEELRLVISDQLHLPGHYERVRYTKGFDRSHCVKGWEDRWQVEARLYWETDILEPYWVNIPGGAVRIDELDVPYVDTNNWNEEWT